eukprot:evm.model.scf_478.5 EVM.evm.TU.scf_478.5   scf_478:82684-83904(+)
MHCVISRLLSNCAALVSQMPCGLALTQRVTIVDAHDASWPQDVRCVLQGWAYLPRGILEHVKDVTLCDSTAGSWFPAKARLVNRHWCSTVTESLVSLSPSGNSNHVVRALQETFTNVRRLKLSQCNSGHRSMEIAELRAVPFITDLDLSSCSIIDPGPALWSCLTSLRTLNLQNCKSFSERGLGSLSHLTSLTSLNLMLGSEVVISDVVFSCLGSLTKLQHLEVGQCSWVTRAGFAHLKSLTLMRCLTLYFCHQIENEDLAFLDSLTSLKLLNMFSCPLLTDAGLKAVGQLNQLEDLRLCRWSKISSGGLTALEGLGSLKRLNLCNCDSVTDTALMSVALLTSLTSLDFSGCHKITDAGVQYLEALPSLRLLNLAYCDKVSRSALRSVASWRSMSSLTGYGFFMAK